MTMLRRVQLLVKAKAGAREPQADQRLVLNSLRTVAFEVPLSPLADNPESTANWRTAVPPNRRC